MMSRSLPNVNPAMAARIILFVSWGTLVGSYPQAKGGFELIASDTAEKCELLKSLSINMNLYMNVIKSNLELTDLRRRQMILDYVERFRTAYNQKDIRFLEQVFSDDALIITGKVITQRHNELFSSQKIEYNKHTKQEYLAKMKRIFQNARYFRITFDQIEVLRHPTNPNFYGVTLLQGYTNNNYHDDGYLFLLWDFTDEDRPQIHVRTWQPDRLNGKPLPKDEIFTLDDFDIN